MLMRQLNQRLMAAGVLAAAAFLALYFSNRDDAGGAIVGAALAFGASVIGLTAVARVRQLPARPLRVRARLIGLSLMIGTALGLVNLILGPVNEQLRSPDDPWLRWVRREWKR